MFSPYSYHLTPLNFIFFLAESQELIGISGAA